MKDDTELIIKHEGKQASSSSSEVDIPIEKGIPIFSQNDNSSNTSMPLAAPPEKPQTQNHNSNIPTDNDDNPDNVQDNQNSPDILDSIHAKMMDYPLPTPKISEMPPPTPPTT